MRFRRDCWVTFLLMGDVTLPTPLAQAEAPFVWLAVGGCAVALSLIPLVALFGNPLQSAQWKKIYGAHPWGVHGYGLLLSTISYVAFWLLASLSYWVCRGGHQFVHRVFPAVSFYMTLVVFALWSLPAMFGYRCLSTLMLGGVLAGTIVFTIAFFLSGTMIAGGLACGAVVSVLGLLVSWFFDE